MIICLFIGMGILAMAAALDIPLLVLGAAPLFAVAEIIYSRLKDRISELELKMKELPETIVFYQCDREACFDRNNVDCHYTSNINHAVNFEKIGNAYWEKGNKDG